MLQLDNHQSKTLDLKAGVNKQEFIERMQRKLEVKEALYKDSKRHSLIERLTWLSFDTRKKHLLL